MGSDGNYIFVFEYSGCSYETHILNDFTPAEDNIYMRKKVLINFA